MWFLKNAFILHKHLLFLANWAYNLLALMQNKISVFGWLWGNICRTKDFCWNSTSFSTQSYWLVYVCCFEIAGLIKGPDRKTLETDITNGLVCRNSYFHGTVLLFFPIHIQQPQYGPRNEVKSFMKIYLFENVNAKVQTILKEKYGDLNSSKKTHYPEHLLYSG